MHGSNVLIAARDRLWRKVDPKPKKIGGTTFYYEIVLAVGLLRTQAVISDEVFFFLFFTRTPEPKEK
jgi:hypothetical protein